jgi:hypothetical protein
MAPILIEGNCNLKGSKTPSIVTCRRVAARAATCSKADLALTIGMATARRGSERWQSVRRRRG